MALLGILAGELLAEAARCARDENPRVVCCRHSFTRPVMKAQCGTRVIRSRWRWHRRMSRIPSASQGPEGGNGGARRFGLRLRLRVAHLQQVAVGIQHLDQADDAPSVGGIRVLARTRERRFTLRQDADLGLAFDEGGEGVLDILGRPQHGQPVCRQRFGLLATRGGDLRIDAAEVEQAPAQSEDAQGLVGTAGEEIAARDRGGAAQQRAERELGVVLRDRHADARIGGGKAPLGHDEIRPAPDHLGWRAGLGQTRRDRDRHRRAQFGAVGSRLHAEQHVQRVHRRIEPGFQDGICASTWASEPSAWFTWSSAAIPFSYWSLTRASSCRRVSACCRAIAMRACKPRIVTYTSAVCAATASRVAPRRLRTPRTPRVRLPARAADRRTRRSSQLAPTLAS